MNKQWHGRSAKARRTIEAERAGQRRIKSLPLPIRKMIKARDALHAQLCEMVRLPSTEESRAIYRTTRAEADRMSDEINRAIREAS